MTLKDQKMEAFEKKLSGLCDKIYFTSKYLLLLVFIMMILTVSVNVVCRYFLNIGLFWSEELCRYGLVWGTFIGAACGYRKHELVAMTLVVRYIPLKTLWKLGLFVEFSILMLLSYGFFYGVKVTLMVQHQISPGMQISMAFPYFSLPLTFMIMMTYNLDNILRYFIKKDNFAAKVHAEVFL